MQASQTYHSVEHALDTICSRGGSLLYDAYIADKLPSHIHESTHEQLTRHLNLPFSQKPLKPSITIDFKPKRAPLDTMTPQKVIHQRSKSQLAAHPVGLKLCSFRQNPNRSFFEKAAPHTTLKPNHCIKFGCEKVDGVEKIDEDKLRKQKRLSLANQLKSAEEDRRNKQQKSYRRQALESKIEELAILGVPIGYDDEGRILTPEKPPKVSKLRKSNILELQFRTLDVGTARYNPEESRSIVGRRKGFSNGKFYKKARMTDEEYNNQNNRQYSTIPFANIAEGVKITEKDKNVIASKTRESILSRDQFVKETRHNFFKSFLPETDVNQSSGSVSDRPNTTGHFNRMKMTADTAAGGRSMRKSILWRPHTTSKSSHVRVNNAQLAKDFVNS